jgi:protein-disulfide isomerase
MSMMTSTFRLVSVLATVLLLALEPARAQSSRADIEAVVKNYLANNPEEVQRIVKDYLMKNPDVLQDALTEFVKRRQATAGAARPDKSAEIKANAKLLFDSPRQVTLGNRSGDATLVEFFDYNCGFCKRALADKLELLKDDPKLKLVLKELPILGPGSTEAARVAVALRMQDNAGEKYLAFHRKLLSERGQANKYSAMAAAAEAGADMARLETDLANAEVAATLEENLKLARTLGISGTPAYVVGEAVVPGAVGAANLKDRIRAARR